jgi:2-octaprenyl-6-methoxyphenol hydroxylase
MTIDASPVLHDIAVIGPGPVGATAALALAHQGFKVALIGPHGARRDGRTVALMVASWDLLERLGAASRLVERAAPLAMMRLVDDTGSLFRRPPSEFRASELGLDQFGWNVETSFLTQALVDAVEDHPAIARIETPVSGVEIGAEAGHLALADGSRLSAKLIVGADGRNSLVRRSSGIVAKEWSYPQKALTTIFRHSRPHRGISTEFHTRFGPCTTVPLLGNRSSLVWMLPASEGDPMMGLDDSALAAAIERRIHSILGEIAIDGPRGLVPMGGLSVERFVSERCALVGEAAHVFPPIGAQGLNLGLRDVASLAASVAASDPGRADGLACYQRSRASDVGTRTRAVDALNRSLLADFLPVDFARGAGLLALDAIAPLRRYVMRQGLDPSRG